MGTFSQRKIKFATVTIHKQLNEKSFFGRNFFIYILPIKVQTLNTGVIILHDGGTLVKQERFQNCHMINMFKRWENVFPKHHVIAECLLNDLSWHFAEYDINHCDIDIEISGKFEKQCEHIELLKL